jgi:flagellar protein FliO/FliZ
VTEGLDLLGRVVVALGSVLGLMWLAARGWRRTPAGRVAAASTLTVLARQGLGPRSQVAVVQVGRRALVLGVADQRIELLADLPAEEALPPVLSTATPLPTGHGALPTAPGDGTVTRGPLDGSALSAATWKRAVEAVRERTVRT